MKKIFFTAVIIFAFSFFGCASAETYKNIKVPTFDENGVYSGFADIKEGYDAEDAESEGTYVIKDSTLACGRDVWEKFLKDSSEGKNSFMRIVHFIGDEPYFTDLYYTDGIYQTFQKNIERGIEHGKEFTMLRKLEAEKGRPSHYYVLTSSSELSHSEVQYCFVGSSLSKMTKIPFEWLGFTVYLNTKEDKK